ncbi:hypothetical protein ACFVYR_24485 [Streptomyces sp. NPDC058284]|uniref:hypothetical protein n=1 Tax=unclassified Streptomyces TaxID=2593676 RepID=UPI0036609D25
MDGLWVGRRLVLALVLVVGVLLAVLGTVGSGLVAYAADGRPPGRTVTTVDETSRAGSRAGEGRERPGQARPGVPDLSPLPFAPPPRQPEPVSVERHQDTQAVPPERPPAGPVLPNLHVLPLGGGLLLIGLGLGFLGWRLRRG